MTSEVEERPRLVTAGYGWHGSQWVKQVYFFHCSLISQVVEDSLSVSLSPNVFIKMSLKTCVQQLSLFKTSIEKRKSLRQNQPDVGVTSGQKPCTKIVYIVLQTSVGLF